MTCWEKNHHGRRHQRQHYHRQGKGLCCRKEGDRHKRGAFRRQYHTREEKRECLENYLADLRLEVQAVEERLEDLQETSEQGRME